MSSSAGVIAGVGVGCFVTAACLTFGLFCLLGRSKRLQAEREADLAGRRACQQCRNPVAPHYQLINLIHGMILPKVPDTNRMTDLLGEFRFQTKNYLDLFVAGEPPFTFDPDAMAAVAGPSKLWARLPEMSPYERLEALTHFVARILYPRLRINDGDESITLLPPGMLAAYQGIMTKSEDSVACRVMAPGGFGSYARPGTEAAISLRHYWRALTAFWTSDVCNFYPDITKGPNEPLPIPDTDPRMPRILAVEELLRGVLEPFAGCDKRFFDGRFYVSPEEQAELDAGVKPQDFSAARKQMRSMTVAAAHLALACFACPTPMEVYWPYPEEPDRPDINFISDARLAKTHNTTFGVRYFCHPTLVRAEWRKQHGPGAPQPGEWKIINKPDDTDRPARRGRIAYMYDVRNSNVPGMSAYEVQVDQHGRELKISGETLEIQMAFGWIKEGEPGLRTAPPNFEILPSWRDHPHYT